MNWIIASGVFVLVGLVFVAYLDNIQEWVEDWMSDSFIEKFEKLFGERKTVFNTKKNKTSNW